MISLECIDWFNFNKEMTGAERWAREVEEELYWDNIKGDYDNWTICQVLFPHAEAVLAYRPTEKKYLVYWSELLSRAGRYAVRKGNYWRRRWIDKHRRRGRRYQGKSTLTHWRASAPGITCSSTKTWLIRPDSVSINPEASILSLFEV